MLKRIVIVSMVMMLISCGNDNHQQAAPATSNPVLDSVAIINDAKNRINIGTTNFSQVDSSAIVLFPLSLSEQDKNSGSFSYKSVPGNTYWNILFLNTKTNEYHLLSDRKMLIRDLDYTSNSVVNTDVIQTERYIFYSIISDDYDKDNKLTTSDPAYLFVSDKEGRNFRQLSPANCSVLNWKFIRSANKVLMTVKKDSDKNNKFDDKDEVVIFEIDIAKGTVPVETISNDFKNKMKLLYNRDWK